MATTTTITTQPAIRVTTASRLEIRAQHLGLGMMRPEEGGKDDVGRIETVGSVVVITVLSQWLP